MEMPKPNEHHETLKRLVGAWAGEETMNPSPWGPGGTATGHYICRAAMDGFYVLQDYHQEKNGRTSYSGHGIFGYDTQKKTFTWYWVDSFGMVPAAPSRGQWNGDVLTFEHEPDGDRRGRYIYEFSGGNAYTFKIENSSDGGKTWQNFMTAHYRRV